MLRAFLVVLLFMAAGCVGPPSPGWDDGVPTIQPLGRISAPQGLLIVRTFPYDAHQGNGSPYRRGFQVLDRDGHQVYRERASWEDWSSVRLFPGRYMVVSFVGDGLFDRHWEKAQVVVAAGKLTAVDFLRPGPREILEE